MTTAAAPDRHTLDALVLRRRDEGRPDRPWRLPPPAARRPAETPAPLSYSQERMRLLESLTVGVPIYNLGYALRLRGDLDVAALTEAVSLLHYRQEILRTAYPATGEQHVLPLTPVRLTTLDLSGSPDAGSEAYRWARAAVDEPFELDVEPPVRWTLLRIAAEDHLLLIRMHHIAMDGWSESILHRELSTLYSAVRLGVRPALAELPVRYGDYAYWQRQRDDGPDLAYWRRALAGSSAALALPFDRRPQATTGFAGTTRLTTVPGDVVAAAAGLARSSHCSLFMVLLATFATLVHRYEQETDLVIGVPVAGRRPELADLLGFFVNTLPVRLDLTGNPTFRELLSRIRDTTLDALAHQEVPLQRILEAVRPDRSPGRPPLVQVSFQLHNTPSRAPELAGLSVEIEQLFPHGSALDLSVTYAETGDGLVGVWEYRTDLFDDATVARLQEQWVRILRAVTADPDRRLGEVDAFDRAGLGEFVRSVNGTAVTRPETTVLDLVSAQVAAGPDRIAVSHATLRVTYRDLDGRANRIARHLRAQGIGQEDLVGVLCRREVDLIAVVLGILKAGAAYLPLDPAQPAARLAGMLAVARPARLLVHESLRDRIAGHQVDLPAGLPVIDVLDQLALEEYSPTDPGLAVDRDQLAYVIFTSGSTGSPKGVCVTHGGLAHYLQWTREEITAGPALLHSPLTFDFTVTSLFWPLITGNEIVLVPEDDPLEELADRLRAPGRSLGLVKLTPAHVDPLLARVERDGGDMVEVGTFFVGGEQLSGPAAAALRRLAPHARIVNEYGPTETVVGCVVHRVGPVVDEAVPTPIGRPIPNMRAYLLDAHGEPVPPGVTGELYLGGAGVGRGYLNRPGLTADRFGPDPFAAAPGGRLYRSGDLARYRPDGTLEFLGRADDQVKIRGHRVELGEIESVLIGHDAVAEAAVVVVSDQRTGDRRLAGFVVAAPDGDVGPEALRAHLTERLPAHMVPASLTGLPELPLTPHGKVDRTALAALAGPVDLAEEYVPARTPAEQVMAGLWAEVLGLPRVGRYDDFFDLGGHSLLASQIAVRVAELFPEAPRRTLMRDLFAQPTLARFTAAVTAGGNAAGSGPAPVITRLAPGRPHRLCRAQERLWFLDQIDPGSAEYLIPVVLRLTGPLDVAALRTALSGIVDRHQVLRTRVSTCDDEPVGVVVPVGEFGLEQVELSPAGLAAAGGVDAVARATSTRPLDLVNGLPIRAVLIGLDRRDHLLCLTLHHIAFDRWSHRVLIAELSTLYAAAVAGVPAPLDPLAFQYADVAALQDSLLTAEVLAAKLEFWQEELAGSTPFELPPDRPRPARRSAHGDTAGILLPDSLASGLETLGRRHGATPFMTVLTVLQALLARYTGQYDITVATTAADRNRAEAESLIGLFVNILPLRGDLTGDPTFAELLVRTRDRAAAAYEHQDVPFDRLVSLLAPDRDLSRTPLFQILVQYDADQGADLRLADLSAQRLASPDAIAKYDLTIEFQRRPDGLLCEVEYDTALYDASTVDRLLAHLGTMIAHVVEAPGTTLHELPLVTADARAELVAGAAGPVVAVPQMCLHELVEEQVARTPAAVAVVDGDREVSYAELDARANQIAGLLRAQGVRPDRPVGVLLDRSVDLVAGLLGVLKAGGAFLPLETSTPAARLAQLLRDAGAPACLVGPGAEMPEVPGCVPVVLDPWDDDALSSTQAPVTAAAVGVLPQHLVALYYTSGSTGMPKGVACTHQGWVNRMRWMQHRHGLPAGATVLHKTTMTFDDSAVEIFWPLLYGGRIALLQPGLHRDPRAIIDAAIRYGCVHLNFVPSVLELVLDALTDADLRGLSQLRSVLSSGEALRPALARQFHDVFAGRVSLDNTWGATEVSIDSTYHVCGPADGRTPTSAVCVGRPLDNNEVHVLDSRLEPMPVGVAGELYIGGLGLARGYHNDPGTTAGSFVPHPFRPGERLYRTGDWGRRQPDGSLLFLERRDHQVKIRGVRIELGEVEAALLRHPFVADAAVTAWEASPGDKRLAAYAVVEPGVTVAPGELRAHLREVLPSYAVPGSIEILAALPRLSSGKLDRRRLPAPSRDPVADTAYVPPSTPVEQALAGIWSTVLGVDRIGANDDFFASGGHSLLATRAIGRMRRVFETAFPLSLIFEAPTIAQAAIAVETAVMATIVAMTEEEAMTEEARTV